MAKSQRKPNASQGSAKPAPTQSPPSKVSEEQSKAQIQSVKVEPGSHAIPAVSDSTLISDNQSLEVRGSTRTSISFQAQFTAHEGPLPDAEYFRKLKEVEPDGPKIILQEFKKQGEHRRDIERMVVMSRLKQSELGQKFAFVLAMVAIVGGFVLIGLGHQATGVGTLLASVGTLAGVFLYTQSRQKKERVEKEQTRQRIAKNEALESVVPQTD